LKKREKGRKARVEGARQEEKKLILGFPFSGRFQGGSGGCLGLERRVEAYRKHRGETGKKALGGAYLSGADLNHNGRGY